MATFSRFRKVDVTTTSTNYELFDDSGVRTALMERYNVTTSDELDELISDGIRNMAFAILVSGTTVSINNETFESPFSNRVVSTGDFVRDAITSIRIADTGIDLEFRFNIL